MAFNQMDERQSHAPISDFDELTQQKLGAVETTTAAAPSDEIRPTE